MVFYSSKNLTKNLIAGVGVTTGRKEVIMRKHVFMRRWRERLVSAILCIAMTGSLMLGASLVKTRVNAAEAPSISENFDDYDSTATLKGGLFGSPTFELSEDKGVGGSKALIVKDRADSYFGYSFNLGSFIGNNISIKAKIAAVDSADQETEKTFTATVAKNIFEVNDQQYSNLGSVICTADYDYQELNITTDIEEACTAYTLYIEGPANQSYIIDDISITVNGEYSDPSTIVRTPSTPSEGAPEIVEDFNDYDDVSSLKGFTFGSPTLSLTADGADASKALAVSDRTQNYFGYALDVSRFVGNTISVKADVKTIETTEPVNVSATIKLSAAGKDDNYQNIGIVETTADAFANIDGTYEIPADVETAVVYFEAPENIAFIIDNISITVVGEYKDPNGGSASSEGYVDTSGYPVLKDLYSGKFLMGVACESISNWNIQTSEIGNPAKENLITSQFNSITFGNELKPEYNMDVKNVSGERTDTFLPFVINPAAKEMLDFAKANGLKVRAHVLVWHSQNADEMFYENYDKSQNLASPAVVKARMTSYIDNTIKYMYENGYGDVIYAWDVVNEAVEPGTNADNLRESLYYRILGKDFLMEAFKQARTSVDTYSAQFGVGKAKLFYNDYNEFQKEKCDAIIENLTPVKNAGYIDGIGMQAHVQDGTNVNDFISALKRYDAAFGEVHITELDVVTTGTGVNAEYYQGKFYYDLFKALLEARAEGVNLTSVTIWGLTDDNSWKAESSPLIFKKNLSRKKAFDGIVAAATGGDIGEPEYVKPDYSDIRVNFDDDTLPSLFSVRGSGTLTIQSEEVFEGKYALLDSGRTATWNGASIDVSKFAGQTIGISAWVKSDAPLVLISADIDGKWPNITSCDTSSGEWEQIIGEYKIPSDLKALKLYFETEDLSDIYIDALRVKVMGKDEGFEDAENFASSRGVGHMPVLTVTDTAAKSGTYSLLVARQEQDATVSFDVSDYIGQYITASVYVKTTDSKITLGIDGDTPVPCATAQAGSDWTKVSATFPIPAGGVSAKLYLETDGKADMYLDDFSVRYAEFTDDVEGSTNVFGTRWGGAGKLSVVDDEDGKAVVLTDNDQTYYGITFDASAYIGNEIDVQFDSKTDDEMVKLSGDIDSVWPNYLSTPSVSGQYKSVGTTIRVPSEYNALKMYVETSGMADLYLDNLLIRRIPVGPEAKVTFNLSAFGMENVTVADRIGYRIPAEEFTLPEGIEITGWYKDAACTEEFDFGTEILSGDITLYATDGTLLPAVEDPTTEDPSSELPAVEDPTTEDPSSENPATEDLSTFKEYQILDGADPSYTIGSGKNVVIHSEGPMVNYKSISFNNVEVPKLALTITDGSTIIEIDSLYLDSLAAGEYDVYISFSDGYSKTKLTIVDADTENKTEETVNEAENGKKSAIVKTGDVNNPVPHIAILILAFGGALTISAFRKKKSAE